MKKIKIILMIICLILLCGCSKTKEPVSSDEFINIMKENNIKVYDATKEIAYAKVAYFYEKDDFKIVFVDANNKTTIDGVFLDESKNILATLDNGGEKTALSGKNWASLNADVDNKYYFVGLIDNTYLYIRSNLKNKGQMLKIIRKLGY